MVFIGESMKYLNQTAIKSLIIEALKTKTLRWNELVSEVQRLSLQEYRNRHGQNMRVSKRLIHKFVNVMIERGLVEKVPESHKKVYYKLKMRTFFEIEMIEITKRLKTMVNDTGMLKAYFMEENKRWLNVSVKAKKRRVTSPFPLERERLVELAQKKVLQDIDDATYGRVLIEQLVDLSLALYDRIYGKKRRLLKWLRG